MVLGEILCDFLFSLYGWILEGNQMAYSSVLAVFEIKVFCLWALKFFNHQQQKHYYTSHCWSLARTLFSWYPFLAGSTFYFCKQPWCGVECTTASWRLSKIVLAGQLRYREPSFFQIILITNFGCSRNFRYYSISNA